ncbi:MAG: hypothetical protein KJ621_07070 [Proteobacteria bacterium]|nr:hypothetical protein [Pseudomonadota bacterium]MBU1741446.1 hypothetical protein [Pseudomonadota bacterium]
MAGRYAAEGAAVVVLSGIADQINGGGRRALVSPRGWRPAGVFPGP